MLLEPALPSFNLWSSRRSLASRSTDWKEGKADWTDRMWKIAANAVCFQWDNTYRHMSWRSYSPSWPYPPAAPVWGCPGGARGRTEKPHIRAIRLGTILLLKEAKNRELMLDPRTNQENTHTYNRDISWSWIRAFDADTKNMMRVRHSHLY